MSSSGRIPTVPDVYGDAMRHSDDFDLEGLMRAIVATPNDDGPRYAYADRLLEMGRDAQAELIISQLANRSDRVRSYINLPGLSGLPVLIRRGFPECVTLNTDTLFRKAETIFLYLPLVRVLFRDRNPQWGTRWAKLGRNCSPAWADRIDGRLWSLMRAPVGDDNGDTVRDYRSQAAAVCDLSNGAVLYGRQEAGVEGSLTLPTNGADVPASGGPILQRLRTGEVPAEQEYASSW